MAKKKKPGPVIAMISRESQKTVSGIVGIDSSLTSLGFARKSNKRLAYDTNPYKVYAIGTDSSEGMTKLERYRFTRDSILPDIMINDIVLMEDYAYGFGKGANQRLVDLAELGGVIRLGILEKTFKEPVMVTPTELKKFFGGTGSLKKDEVKLKAFQQFNREFKTTDEAEAFALMVLGIYIVTGKEAKYRYQNEIIQQIRERSFC